LFKSAVSFGNEHPTKTIKSEGTITSEYSGILNMTSTSRGIVDKTSGYIRARITFSGYDYSSKETTTLEMDQMIFNRNGYSNINGTWVKVPASSLRVDGFDANKSLDDILQQSLALEIVGEENVNGVPCYVVSGSMAPASGIQLTKNLYHDVIVGAVQESYSFKSGAITIWIGKDTPRILKIRQETNVDLNCIPTHTVVTFVYYDWDVPVQADIPPEIKNL